MKDYIEINDRSGKQVVIFTNHIVCISNSTTHSTIKLSSGENASVATKLNITELLALIK